jgi:predicted metal-dependent hydrolase
MQKVISHPEIGEVTLSKTRRSRRIMLSVRPGGTVRLSFPVWVTQKRALKFLDEKTEWIAAARLKIAEKYPDVMQDEHFGTPPGTNHSTTPPGSTPGTSPNTTNQGSNHSTTNSGTINSSAINPDTTPTPHPGIPSPADRAERKAAQKRAIEELRKDAKIKLPPMVARLAAEHGFRHGTIRVKATRSRWGSCTSRNDINLSLALAALPTHLAEYVILHELCHTVHRNHSHRFHALLDRVTDGRSKALNKELRQFRPEFLINRQ